MSADLYCPDCEVAMTIMGRERRRDLAGCLAELHIEGVLRGLAVCPSCQFHVLLMQDGDIHLVPAEVFLSVAYGAPRGLKHVDVDLHTGEVKTYPVRDIGEN